MEAIRLFHLVARWLLVLIEAGGMLWLLALFLALLGWLGWGAAALFGRLRNVEGRYRQPVQEVCPARRY